MKINKEAILQAAKEIGRLALFAAIAAMVTYITSKLTSLDPGSLEALILTFLLRFIDKYVHENPNINSNGIAPF